ncbi:hypothetical protein F8M41_002925 [Gigaspora margarita]|uniref:Uncharacterized protein n=1 Tax=Gigaspora margarita TaxID=4874 RepID=A0A8H4AYF5_GIGMA|nr:hypothetical protein F8M41_002925 [Gigaspora margarita]
MYTIVSTYLNLWLRNNEGNKRATGEKSRIHLGETLRDTYESWLRKVEEFRNSDKWNEENRPAELSDQELANTNESAEEVRVEKDERKAPIRYQESADMDNNDRINNPEECDKKGSA